MTNYDEWKTTEPYNAEGDFVDRKTGELVMLHRNNVKVVTEVIAELLFDDGNDFFAEKMARLVIAVDLASEGYEVARAGYEFWNTISPMVMDRIKRDAETAAQAAWDNRLTGPEGDL